MGEFKAGDRYVYVPSWDTRPSVWEARSDGFSQLVSSDGSISFIGGKRCLITTPQKKEVLITGWSSIGESRDPSP